MLPSVGLSVTVVLDPVKDNTLFENSVNNSNGSGPHIFAGGDNNGLRKRALFAFNIGPPEIPEGSTIEIVSLALHVNRTRGTADSFSLRKLTRDWGEADSSTGRGTGASAQAGDATWNQSMFNSQNSNSPGGDFLGISSGNADLLGSSTTSTFIGPQMIADVQDWLDNPFGNFGWILIGPSSQQTARRIDSREASNASNRPKLTIEFTPGEVDPFEGVDLGGGFFFSDWYGIYNPMFFPWVFHVEHGFQFVFVVTVGEVFLYDLECDEFWWTSSALQPGTFYSFSRNAFIFYFAGSTNPRNFVNLETEEFFSKPAQQ